MRLLSRSEEIVLLSIWKLQGNAYGVTIRKQVSKITGKNWSIGAIYAPLHRVEKKGLVRTVKSDPLPERGGRSKVYYEITPKGKKALLETKKVHDSMWVGIFSLEFERE
ncbi:MAG: PadR family transcriptional regulator [Candidatus Aminicenantes bacterium]|nr:PadR family transcriptional regulator [Candidatus Aminicenantes bacterium]